MSRACGRTLWPALALAIAGALCSAARADSASLLAQAQAADPGRYNLRSAVKTEIMSSSGKSPSLCGGTRLADGRPRGAITAPAVSADPPRLGHPRSLVSLELCCVSASLDRPHSRL